MDAPSVSPANASRIYYDSTLDYMLLSENGGAYSRLMTLASGGGVFLKLDCSNDPLTDSLEIRKTNATSVLTLSRNQAAVASSDIVARLEAYTFDITDPGVSAKIEALSYGTSGETGWRFSTGTPSVLAEVMQIDYLGNVGIGIPWPDSPGSKLEVGNARVSAGVIAIREDLDDGVSKVTFTVPALAASLAYTLPPAFGAAGSQLTDAAGNGILSWAAAGAGAGGDALTVNTVAIDTTGDITDSTDVTWLVTDGGAGGPDIIKGYVVDDSHAHTGATLSGIDISADTNLTAGDFLTLTDDDLDVDTAAVTNGDTTHLPTCDGVYDFVVGGWVAGAGVFDLGGATSLEVPNTAGDVTVDTIGEIAVDSTQEQLVVNDGTEVAIPLRHIIYGPLYLTGAYDIETDYPILFLDSTVYPDGIVITSWSISSTNADPTTELDANLRYCDDPGLGAYPGANPVLIDVMDTTTGNASETNMALSDLGSGVIPADKAIYIDMDADPTDTDTYWILKIEFYILES